MKKKKSLGQHFLYDAHYLRAVADAARIKKGETVLEVGPGEGTLTERLLAFGCQVLAIEKDKRLVPLLQKKFAQEIERGDLILIEGDALLFNPESYKLKTESYKLVGNIPYYITGALLKKFLSARIQPSTLVFLVQKEVAERITRSRKEGILSLAVKAYGAPRYVKTVPRGAFSPPPKVDSAILAVEKISRKNFMGPSTSLRTASTAEKKFFELLHAGFGQKRKQLGKRLGVELEKTGIASTARAEDLTLAQWIALSRAKG